MTEVNIARPQVIFLVVIYYSNRSSGPGRNSPAGTVDSMFHRGAWKQEGVRGTSEV